MSEQGKDRSFVADLKFSYPLVVGNTVVVRTVGLVRAWDRNAEGLDNSWKDRKPE